jgi:hypothetical protein
MKVSTKVAAGFALHVVILIALLVYHVHMIREAVRTSYELPEVAERHYIAASYLRIHLSDLRNFAARYNAPNPELRNEGLVDRFNETVGEFDQDLETLNGHDLSTQLEKRLRVVAAMRSDVERE